jgi:predicted SprT family Zn-dependent metalloprotease
MKSRTYNRCEDLRRLAKDLFDVYDLREWSFTFDRAPSRAGACDTTNKNISISIHFVENPKTTWHHLNDILLHEIAHALTPDHNHDSVWRDVAKSIGSTGKRYAPHCARDPTYRFRCPCKAVDFRRHYVHDAHTDTMCTECGGDVIILEL